MICECSPDEQKFTHYDTCKTCGGDRSIEWDGFIRQRRQDDCVVAATAMALGVPYEEVLKVARRKKFYREWKGTYSDGSLLKEFGMTRCSHDKLDGNFRHVYAYNSIFNQQFWRESLWGRKCLISMPSLNNFDGYHKVYYDGAELWDPQWDSKRRAKTLDDIVIDSALIFRADY